jgi:HEAT repeat protein
VRSSAAEALLVIGPTRDDLPALLKVIKDRSSSTKAAAAEAIGRLGAPAKDAVPQLRRLLDEPDSEVRIAATEALGRIGPAALPAAAKLKEFRADPIERAAAQRALERISPK